MESRSTGKDRLLIFTMCSEGSYTLNYQQHRGVNRGGECVVRTCTTVMHVRFLPTPRGLGITR